jgi:hypothetical protein
MRHELSIFEIGGDKVLSGQPRGQLFFGRLVSSVKAETEASPVLLNFKNVDLMTSSFFRVSILPFRDYAIGKLNLYPVLANVSDDTLDEIRVVLEPLRDAVITCKLSSRGDISEAKLLGVLEEKQKLTLDAVLKAKEADASILKKHSDAAIKRRSQKSEEIGLTGWNNRLAALVAKGLLIETKRGRGKLYRPVVEFGYGQ